MKSLCFPSEIFQEFQSYYQEHMSIDTSAALTFISVRI